MEHLRFIFDIGFGIFFGFVLCGLLMIVKDWVLIIGFNKKKTEEK